jgi:acetyl esterase
VVSVEYRRSPEATFPGPLEDCYAAAAWVESHVETLGGDPDRIAVAGASSGGNLAAALALVARDRGGPSFRFQLLAIPVTDHAFDTESYLEYAEGYHLTRKDMQWYWEQYLHDDVDGRHPYASPLQARSLAGLPPAAVMTAEFDPLRDDGLNYVERLRDADVPVTHRHYDGMYHGFLTDAEPYAAEAAADMASDLREVFGT